MTRRNDEQEERNQGRGGSAFPWLLLVLVLALAGTAAFWGWQRLLVEQGRGQIAERELARAEEGRATLEARVGELTGRLEEKEAALAKLEATYTSLEDKMKAEIGRGDVRLTQANGKIQVDLIDRILFDSGEADLSPRGKDVLGRLGGVLASLEDRRIQVSGHTDNARISEKLSAKFPTNWELSVTRAVNVVRYLSEDAKVPPKRLTAAGYGEFHPVATNATPEGRARNRRIELLLTPAIEAKKAPLPAVARKAER